MRTGQTKLSAILIYFSSIFLSTNVAAEEKIIQQEEYLLKNAQV